MENNLFEKITNKDWPSFYVFLFTIENRDHIVLNKKLFVATLTFFLIFKNFIFLKFYHF